MPAVYVSNPDSLDRRRRLLSSSTVNLVIQPTQQQSASPQHESQGFSRLVRSRSTHSLAARGNAALDSNWADSGSVTSLQPPPLRSKSVISRSGRRFDVDVIAGAGEAAPPPPPSRNASSEEDIGGRGRRRQRREQRQEDLSAALGAPSSSLWQRRKNSQRLAILPYEWKQACEFPLSVLGPPWAAWSWSRPQCPPRAEPLPPLLRPPRHPPPSSPPPTETATS